MLSNYASRPCCYETNASRCGFGICIALPLMVLTAFMLGILHGPGKLKIAEPKVTIIKIMPAPPEPEPLLMPVEEYSPKPIQPMAPLEAPKPKPVPQEQPKPKPAPQIVDKPVNKQPVDTAPPTAQAAGPNVGAETIKAAGPPRAAEGSFSKGDYDLFLSAFLAKIRQELVYPRAAQKANISGTVKVNINFDANGNVTSYQLASGNYNKMLGDAAEKTIARVKAAWKPPMVPGKAQTIVVPVVFELK